MKYIKTIILLFIISLLTVGCTSGATETEDKSKLTIYTTVYPIQYAIERIAEDTVTLETVYPPGVDAHSYEPTSKDITAIAKSDAFIYLGAGMEAFAETAADALENQDVSLIEIGLHEELFHMNSVNQSFEHDEQHNEEKHHEDDYESDHEGHNHEDENDSDHDGHNHEDDLESNHDGHNHGDHDPHIWIDPLRMIELSEIIKEELIKLNPESKEVYSDNFLELKEDLQTLDEQFTSLLEKENTKILVSHAAYGYWEERYGLEQIPINGLSSSSEPSQKELTKIIDQAREHDLKYIIFEQNSSNRISEIIQEEIGAEVVIIHNLAVLTDNDMKNGEDYLTLMEANLEVLNQVTQ